MELECDYDLELEKVIKIIKRWETRGFRRAKNGKHFLAKKKAKLVCLQLPEGLKPQALKITDEIESKTSAKCLIWMNSCFGACDVPNLDHIKPKIDLLIQWGHTNSIKQMP